jgi:hypothetical protein
MYYYSQKEIFTKRPRLQVFDFEKDINITKTRAKLIGFKSEIYDYNNEATKIYWLTQALAMLIW